VAGAPRPREPPRPRRRVLIALRGSRGLFWPEITGSRAWKIVDDILRRYEPPRRGGTGPLHRALCQSLELRGDCYRTRGEAQKALADFDAALEVNPRDNQTWWCSGSGPSPLRCWAARRTGARQSTRDDQLVTPSSTPERGSRPPLRPREWPPFRPRSTEPACRQVAKHGRPVSSTSERNLPERRRDTRPPRHPTVVRHR
jgi:tetratricopeptide (TPR) repeat protein